MSFQHATHPRKQTAHTRIRMCTPDNLEDQGGPDSLYLLQKMNYDETVSTLKFADGTEENFTLEA